MTQDLHPRQALFSGDASLRVLAACEHFAGSEKLITKAMALQEEMGPLFDITCDCEDGARIGEEKSHAEMVAAAIASRQNRFDRVGVRIHDPSHPHWKTDVEIIVGATAARLAYVTVPKAVSAAQVQEVSAYVQQVAKAAGGSRAIPIHVVVETHGALEEAFQIARVAEVEVLDFGQMDFVSDHHGAIPAAAMRSPAQFQHHLLIRAKCEVVAAALAQGVVPAHNVCMALKDEAIIRSDASRARNEFGFLRMWSIHPAQIRPIVEAMQPDFDEAALAADILLAAQRNHWGPIQHLGELHDRATYRYYWSILERAQATGMALPPEAQRRFFAEA